MRAEDAGRDELVALGQGAGVTRTNAIETVDFDTLAEGPRASSKAASMSRALEAEEIPTAVDETSLARRVGKDELDGADQPGPAAQTGHLLQHLPEVTIGGEQLPGDP